MPSFGPAGRNLKQDVTYWSPNGVNGFNETIYSPPVLLKGYMVQQSATVNNTAGEQVQSSTAAYLDTDVEEDGWLATGDQTAITDPTQADGAYKIQAFRSSPDLRNLSQERRAFL